MKLSQFSIGARLGSGFAVVIALALGVAALGMLANRHLAHSAESGFETSHQVRVVTEWQGHTRLNLARTLLLAQTVGNAEVKESLSPQIKATSARISELQKTLEGLGLSGEEQAAYEAVGAQRKAYIAARDGATRLADEAKTNAAMTRDADARVTKLGRFLRYTRIDELPQIINVLRGEMSFVGPRPERPEFVEGFLQRIPFYKERYRVKPGITGWAQLCYPYGAGDRETRHKLQYDLYYVKNNSLFLDIMILIDTVQVVLFGKGGR